MLYDLSRYLRPAILLEFLIPLPFPISHGAAGSDVRIAGEGFGLATTLARDGKGASSGLDGPPAGTLEDQMVELLDEIEREVTLRLLHGSASHRLAAVTGRFDSRKIGQRGCARFD